MTIAGNVARPFVKPCWTHTPRLGVWSQWGHDAEGYLRCFAVEFDASAVPMPARAWSGGILPPDAPRRHTGWKPHEDIWVWASRLLPFGERGAAYRDIAAMRGCTVKAVRSRASWLGPEPVWAGQDHHHKLAPKAKQG